MSATSLQIKKFGASQFEAFLMIGCFECPNWPWKYWRVFFVLILKKIDTSLNVKKPMLYYKKTDKQKVNGIWETRNFYKQEKK